MLMFSTNTLLHLIFRGLKCQPKLKSTILDAFCDPGRHQNRPLGWLFSLKKRKWTDAEMTWVHFGIESGPRIDLLAQRAPASRLNQAENKTLRQISWVFRKFTSQIKHLVWSFNKKNDQCIKEHIFYFWMILLAAVFRWFTTQIKHLVWSFNKKNDQCNKAHLFCFSVILLVSVFR